VWGFRLASHLLVDRIIGHPEEGRYQELRRQWKTRIEFKFLLFFQFQALLCVVLSAPFYLASRNTAESLTPLDCAGVAVWAIGIAGEAIADRQLAAFKHDPSNRGKTCRVGLWNYSRHPNYFFEWLIWVGIALFGIGAPYGSIGLISPALILYFLLRVTGIPATEAQALRSRGLEYRRYQETTSAFIPWPPKRSATQ
jgi:steroid 5-alpha reductase family enzyme